MQVGLRSPQFHDIQRQKHLASPSNLTGEIARCAMELIRDNWDLSSPIRAITVTGIYLAPEQSGEEQLDLFSDGAEQRRRRRQERLAHAVDGLRDRFGAGSIRPASCLRRDAGKRSGEE